MFGSDVVLRSIEDFERCGLAPYLGRVGLDHRARALAPLRFELSAVAARTARTAERVSNEHRSRVPGSLPGRRWLRSCERRQTSRWASPVDQPSRISRFSAS